MRIIQPYGRSVTVKQETETKRRFQQQAKEATSPLDIAEFIDQEAKLVIAYWISALDKIIKKPRTDKKASPEQYALRQQIGEAFWEKVKSRIQAILNENKSPNSKDISYYHKIWQWKLHPYGDAGTAHQRKMQSLQGRLFKRFLGKEDLTHDFFTDQKRKQLADDVDVYLYGDQQKYTPIDAAKRSKSFVENQAYSIEKNVASLKQIEKALRETEEEITKAQIDDYLSASPGDLIEEIKKEEYYDGVCRLLYAHYGKVFQKNGRVLTFAEAKQEENLKKKLEIHWAVKDYYKREFSNHKGSENREFLPKDKNAFPKRLESYRRNRRVSALVRLGRVLHYQLLESTELATRYRNWFDSSETQGHLTREIVENSPYWTSEKQGEIKSQEALVRVWRSAISAMARSLKNLVDPHNLVKEDILVAKGREGALACIKDNENFTKQAQLFFGDHLKHFDLQDNEAKTAFAKAALKILAALRNNSFHFKDVTPFLGALGKINDLPRDFESHLLRVNDQKKRQEKIYKQLEGAGFFKFFDKKEGAAILNLIKEPGQSTLPMPSFSGLLTRVENAWRGHDFKDIILPRAFNGRELEIPQLHSLYVTLKLCYDGPFKNWVSLQSADFWEDYIAQAIGRADQAAKKINGRNGGTDKDLLESKIAKLPPIKKAETITDYFARLFGVTATEMRVQKGYESDGEQARQQAAFIENFKRDLILLAFNKYVGDAQALKPLKDKLPQINKILRENIGVTEIEDAIANASSLKLSSEVADIERAFVTPEIAEDNILDRFYFILHFCPVEMVNHLQQQLYKWLNLRQKSQKTSNHKPPESEKEDQIKAFLELLSLYGEMHDDKFTQEVHLYENETIKSFYEDNTGFTAIFSTQPTSGPRQQAKLPPYRGLREMLRHGHLTSLKNRLQQKKISQKQISDWKKLDQAGEIAQLQDRRAQLHKGLVRKRRKSNAEINEYNECLQKIIQYRHLSAWVTLRDHTKLHHILMQIMGRLVDYAGLWERDLYFIFLALLWQNEDQVKSGANKELKKGQIVKAIKAIADRKSHKNKDYSIDLEELKIWDKSLVDIRNDFAHFNDLNPEEIIHFSLAQQVDKARQLMQYDRKLKNAVAKSISDLLAKEHIKIDWKIRGHQSWGHELKICNCESTSIQHLRSDKLTEVMQSDDFITLFCSLMGIPNKSLVKVSAQQTQKTQKTQKAQQTSNKQQIQGRSSFQKTSKTRPSNQKKDKGAHTQESEETAPQENTIDRLKKLQNQYNKARNG